MKRFLAWADNHLLFYTTAFLIVFIPLWPKIPLLDLEYTFISIRLDDIVVGLAILAWVVKFIRKKVTLPPKPILYLILGFWASVFVSYVLGAYVNETIANKNLGLLNALRRVEYMMLFFVAYTSFTHKKQYTRYLYLFLLTTTIVGVYGLLQKYGIFAQPLQQWFYRMGENPSFLQGFYNFMSTLLVFPAFQTMNPEFAKGIPLQLRPEDRVSSMFAGHYDLAAFMVFAIPIITAFLFKKNLLGYIAYFAGITSLILTASRISFGAYIVSIVPLLIVSRRLILLLITVIATGVLMYATDSSTSLAKRFADTVQVKNVFVDKSGSTYVPQEITPDKLPAGNKVIGSVGEPANITPEEMKKLEQDIATAAIKEASRQGKVLSQAELKRIIAERSKEYLAQKSVLLDISASVRFDVSWPRAMKAFNAHPWFGAGPYSIGEATDGDYHRALGEFGLVGTVLFFSLVITLAIMVFKAITPWKGIIFFIWPYVLVILLPAAFGMGYMYKTSGVVEPAAILLYQPFQIAAGALLTISAVYYLIRRKLLYNPNLKSEAVYYGYIAGVIGLLFNATLIDVFEASKVAYIFWLMSGIVLKSITLKETA